MTTFTAAVDMNLAGMQSSMIRDLGLMDLSPREMSQTRVTRVWNRQSDEYDYIIRTPGHPGRTVTTREIVDARESRAQQRTARERQMEMESMRRMTVNLRPPPSGIRELRIEPREGYAFSTYGSEMQARIAAEGERIREQAMQRIRETEARTQSNHWADGWATFQAEPGLPPVPRSVPRWPSVRFHDGQDFTEQETRSHIAAMNGDISSLRAADREVAALVVKPTLIRAIKHHLRHEVFVTMEPYRMPVAIPTGEVDVSYQPPTPQQVISSESDMLLGYRLVADDAAAPYWIVVKPRR